MTRPAHARPNGPAGDPEALRDDVLLDAAHSGDADAFGVLRERYHGTALAVARSRTGSTEEAEGVAAAALGRIEQIVGEGGGPRAFLGAFVVWMVGREADGGTRPGEGTTTRSRRTGAVVGPVAGCQEGSTSRRAPCRW